MKRKPNTCEGCPLYGDGYGWVPDTLDDSAPLLVIEMYPSTYEARVGQSRVGMTVEDYYNRYEKYAGPTPKSYARVIRCRGQKGTKLPTGKKQKEGAKFCRQYDRVPDATKLVVLAGEDVARQLRPDMTSHKDWRGFILPEREE